MVRVDEETNLGVAVSTDCNGRFAKLDPYAGAQLALAESYRNVATGGAAPLAITDCLNFGSPEDPDVMWQFAEACRGLKDGCLELGIPVTGGNVSLYNQTGETAILPTPVVAVLGVIEDVTRRTPSAWSAAGEQRLPARRDPRGALRLRVGARRARSPGRSAAARRPGGREGARPRCSSRRVGLLTSAHDLSDGGLAQTLVESSLRNMVGVSVGLEGDAFVGLFAESAGRVVVTVAPGDEGRLADLAARHGVPSPRSASPAATASSSRASSPRRCSRCAPPGWPRCRPRWPEVPPSAMLDGWTTGCGSPARGRCPQVS